MPCLFIPHGGGPCFFMDGPPPFDKATWAGMERYLRGIGASVAPRPKAILVISGHWDAETPTLNTARHHSLFYDYYGFPEHTYQLAYPAEGSPELAGRVRQLFADAGLPLAEDATRGLDHGVFIPFKLIYPNADLPIVQLSLRSDMDPAAHLAIGRALAPLRDEGILIVGTDMSYHNLREFRRRRAIRGLRCVARRGGPRPPGARCRSGRMGRRAVRPRLPSGSGASDSVACRRGCGGGG
jgi:aromatic ring-opening dioxygenase catalytic subunit (LigB family)